jgi:hypothetical protein
VSVTAIKNALVEEITNGEFQDALAHYLRQRYNEAFDHKTMSGTERQLLRNLRVKKGIYQPDEIALLGGIDVYLGISALKSRAAESWLLDVVMNNMDKPWSLEPTPIPTLPDEYREQAITMLAKEVQGMQSMDEVRERATDLKRSILEYLSKQAKTATQAMETKIEDQFDEGDWRKTFASFIADLCAYPSAIIRGPVIVSQLRAQYKGNAVVAEEIGVPVVRCISPFDAYPSPDSTTTQDGQYFIERARFSHSDLYDLKGVESFDETNIRRALEEYPTGFQVNLNHDAERDRLEGTGPDLDVSKELYDIIIYNGKLPGKFLVERGVLVDDPQKHYECEVWSCGDFTLRAVLNPNPVSARPLHSTSFSKVNGAFWGEAPIDLTYDIQRMCNSTIRAIIRNMAYASGPIAEVVAERLTSGESITQIDPYRMYFVTPDISGAGQKAISFNKVPSVVAEMSGALERFMKLADDISGIPAYVVGTPAVAGAGRTMGGLSMLMGNAAKGIKAVMLNIDDDVVGAVVKAFYYFNLVTSEDQSIKADANVIARGTSGLLQRELMQNQVTEILQILQPYTQPQGNQPPIVGPEAIQYLLRKMLQDRGIDVDEVIPDPTAIEQAQSSAREQATQQAMGGPSSPAQPDVQPQSAAGAQGAISASGAPPIPAPAPAPAGAPALAGSQG